MKTIFKEYNGETFIYLNHDYTSETFLDILQNIAYIQFAIDIEDKEVNVSYIYVDEKYRGLGYSEYLIQTMFKYVYDEMKNEGINQYNILLDDMSDRFGMENNLYLKMGFEYCERDENGPCGPEMILTIVIDK